MSFKLHLIRCNFPDISYVSVTQKNKFQFLNEKSGEMLHPMLSEDCDIKNQCIYTRPKKKCRI